MSLLILFRVIIFMTAAIILFRITGIISLIFPRNSMIFLRSDLRWRECNKDLTSEAQRRLGVLRGIRWNGINI
jgi:hypothetical protein